MTDAFGRDDILLAEARAGDRQALEALLERYQAQVYGFGMKMCGNPEDAEDEHQETMLTIARNIRSFRGTASLSTWLYTIARNACIRMHRRSKFAPGEANSVEIGAAAETEGLAHPARSAEEVLAGKQVERALGEAIGELEPMYREVLLLRDVEGLTAPEVAEVLGVTIQAVKSRLHRARLSVRERVAFQLDTLGQALRDLLGQPLVREAAILSTCNRTEVYFNGADAGAVARWLEAFHRVPQAIIFSGNAS